MITYRDMDGSIKQRQKFSDPTFTAKGERRASVDYRGTKTLWFNTGTLCNIECAHCYIESSPTNDRLEYLSINDVTPYLDEVEIAGETGIEIGFTGGEPFMAPDILPILSATLDRGHHVLVLTNAMKPMMRKRIQAGLKALNKQFPDRLVLRVSLDHYTAKNHDLERGSGSFQETLYGLKWLEENAFQYTIAGRTVWNEQEMDARAGYVEMCQREKLSLDSMDPVQLVLFPEMTPDADPPEITTDCWTILNKDPSEIMCASQRMVIKRRGAASASVTACTLLPYDPEFELGNTLLQSRRSVALNNVFCATFCVLGGGSCSG